MSINHLTPLGLLAIGFLFGMRHAFEPDHLAAVSTLVSGGRKASSSAALGGFWGLGHTLSIFLLGGTLLVLRIDLPTRAQAMLELAVAAMLVLLGGRGLTRAWRLSRSPGDPHAHGSMHHNHGGESVHFHVGPFALSARALMVGLVHGLAGTGALASLVMATSPTIPGALVYLASFGLGSLLGMAGVTFAAGASLASLRSARGQALLSSATGLGSFAFGIFWAAQQWKILR